MKRINNKVDINAYVLELKHEIMGGKGEKKARVIIKNLNYGEIIAIKFSITAKDSFGDEINLENSNKHIFKITDLSIKECNVESIIINLGNYDIKQIEVEIIQIVFRNIGVVESLKPEYVEYTYDILEENSHEEQEQLHVMKKINKRAVCYPCICNNGWVCACGYYNKLSNTKCVSCNEEKTKMIDSIQSDKIMNIINERKQIELKNKQELEKKQLLIEEKKVAQQKERSERQKILLKKRKKKSLSIAIFVCAVIVTVIIISIFSRMKYAKKFGLSHEEKKQYDIALSNYEKINYVCSDSASKYYDIASEYMTDYNGESKLNKAEKNKDYIYLRGYYLASPFLYDIIKDQFPEKYCSIYEEISNEKKAKVYLDYKSTEIVNVENSYIASEDFDEEQRLDESIEKNTDYLNEEILNPEKVSLEKYNFVENDTMKEKVYGIKLGILFYDDGSIMYIGEFMDNEANGYGYAWYNKEDGGGILATGMFKKGYINEAEIHYGKDGNINDIEDTKNVMFKGEFVGLDGFTNYLSPEVVANQTAKAEENDIDNAKKECERYLTELTSKQEHIVLIDYSEYPEVDGEYYYFSCTVKGSGLKRTGTVTVVKQSDGSFKAQGLMFD